MKAKFVESLKNSWSTYLMQLFKFSKLFHHKHFCQSNREIRIKGYLVFTSRLKYHGDSPNPTDIQIGCTKYLKKDSFSLTHQIYWGKGAF